MVEPKGTPADIERKSEVNSGDTLVVIAYTSDSRAQAARERLEGLSVEDYLQLDLAACLTKDDNGTVKLEHTGRHSGLRGRFGRQRSEADVDSEVVEEAAGSVGPGGAALFLVVRGVNPEKVVPEIVKYGGTVIKTSLPADREELLKEAFAGQLTSEEISTELGG